MRHLYPYQVQGAEYLRKRKRAFLFDDPGLGKSTQALAALPIAARAIVVCPASVKSVWANECKVVRPDLSTSVLSGRSSFRFPQVGEIVILNPEILPERPPPEVKGCILIGDEAQAFKTTTTKRSRAFRMLGFACGQSWVMTGTPIQSKPPDLWGISYAVHMEHIWGSWNRFVYLFRGYPTNWGMKWGTPRGEVVDIIKEHFLGRKREEVLPQLPTKTYKTIRVSTGRVRDAEGITQDQIIQGMDRERAGGLLAKARAALALAKAESGQVQDLLRMWVDEAPLIVFSHHVEAAKVVASTLGVPVLCGSSSVLERDSAVTMFKRGQTKAIVGTIGAMGVGLTLTEGWRVVFIDRAWNPSDNEQAEDRACRIGQTRGVEVIDLVSADSDLDETVFRLLKSKSKIIDASVEAARG